MQIKKVIVGVSGGPDSIYLLDKLIKDNKYQPIVVLVNYHLRDESNDEQLFVENICKKNKLLFFAKDVNQDDWNKYKYLGNKQSSARQLRYDFYFKIAKENNVKNIFIAHHKDDFIETAIMQYKKSNDYLFYGIKEKNTFGEFVINRPLIDKWKDELQNELDSKKIEYKIDKSNFEPIYERNKIRIELSKKSLKEKEKIYKRFKSINNKKIKLEIITNDYFDKFKKSNFDWNVFNSIPKYYKKYVVYKLMIDSKIRIYI